MKDLLPKESIEVTEDIADLRIDKALAELYEGHSRSYFQYLIDSGHVTVNGKPVKKREKLQEGDLIELEFIKAPEITLEPQDIPLDILFEDDHILVINKPVGMVVHPAVGHHSGTFVNALLFHCKSLETKQSDVRPGIVHRLDKDTSGVLIAAKTLQAHSKLVASFSNREVRKTYLAICLNRPTVDKIEAPIGRHPVRRKEMAIVENGRPAISLIKNLYYDNRFSLNEIDLITGRTHQIRVHMKSINCPILGDALYGNTHLNEELKIDRQLLHAYKVEIKHPISGLPLEFKAPMPRDFKDFLIKINAWEKVQKIDTSLIMDPCASMQK